MVTFSCCPSWPWLEPPDVPPALLSTSQDCLCPRSGGWSQSRPLVGGPPPPHTSCYTPLTRDVRRMQDSIFELLISLCWKKKLRRRLREVCGVYFVFTIKIFVYSIKKYEIIWLTNKCWSMFENFSDNEHPLFLPKKYMQFYMFSR